jgi:hypothetical protein
MGTLRRTVEEPPTLSAGGPEFKSRRPDPLSPGSDPGFMERAMGIEPKSEVREACDYHNQKMDCTLEMRQPRWAHFAEKGHGFGLTVKHPELESTVIDWLKVHLVGGDERADWLGRKPGRGFYSTRANTMLGSRLSGARV